jgi:hypothetical protein
VRELNKKVLVIAVALMAVAMLATPLVSAKPTSATNNAKSISFVWHSENGASTPVEEGLKGNPPWAIPIDPDTIPPVLSPDTKVTHGISTWTLNPAFSNYVQIGEDPSIPIDAVTGYEGELYVQSLYSTPTISSSNYHVYEKIMWGDDNYIEIMCLERAHAELLLDSEGNFIGYDFYASGIFSGHGVIDGQKVQVTGIREGFVDPSIGFVLECYGTIRFAGNA